MTTSRLKSSLPWVLLGLGVAVLGGEIVLVQRELTRAKQSSRALDQKRQEHDRLLRQVPAPTFENGEAIAAAVNEATHVVAARREKVGARPPAEAVPAGSVEAFFELGRFTEEMRKKALETKVEMSGSEHFGFAAYARAGPEEKLLRAVHRQRAEAAIVLNALLEARPIALLAVKRTPPASEDAVQPALVGEDYFTFRPELSLRRPGLMEADAFRLEFSGQTEVLRRFLNTLATMSPPIVVRAVEAGPAAEITSPSSESYQRPRISKFAVTLEIPLLAEQSALP